MMILATANAGKVEEFTALLCPTVCIPQSQLGIISREESGLSFVENALLKARHASMLAQSPALADDSGLVVEALGGEPGIYSSRYALFHASTDSNIQYLLKRMQHLPFEARRAYFYCVLVWMRHANDPAPLIATGQWHGLIAEAPAGTSGFGYDPIFYVPDYQCTAAQLDSAIKNTISHRAMALAQLREVLNGQES